MRYLSYLLCCSFLILISSCDKPLRVEPGDDVPAILLEVEDREGRAHLNWEEISHSGFQGYWVLRVPDEVIEIEDSVDISAFETVFTTSNPANNSFVDSIPIPMGSGTHYQVFSLINGRMISSNRLPGIKKSILIEGKLISEEVAGGDGFLYCGIIDPDSSVNLLVRYDIDRGEVVKKAHVIRASRGIELAYGDFGTGEKEIAVSVPNGAISTLLFLDPQTLEVNEQLSTRSYIYNILALPTGVLAVLYGAENELQTFDRDGNKWGETFTYKNHPRTGFDILRAVPNKDELLIYSYPGFLYRMKFDQAGVFTLNAGTVVATTSKNAPHLGVDPQGRYCLADPEGRVQLIENFQGRTAIVAQLDALSRFGGFNTTGSQLLFASQETPSVVRVFSRDEFKLLSTRKMVAGVNPNDVVHIDGLAYFFASETSGTGRVILTPF